MITGTVDASERTKPPMHAHQIMSRSVVTVTPDTPIVEAARLMLLSHIGGLPVVDVAGRLVGIVSDGDFIRPTDAGTGRKRGRWLGLLMNRDHSVSDFLHADDRTVSDIMTPDPVTVTEATTLADIVQVMEDRNVKRLPVVNDGRVVGMVTSADFVRALADLASSASGPTPDDDTLRVNVLAALGKAPCRRSRFNVTVRDGVAQLSGAVRNDKLRQDAVAAAQSVAGVKAVSDHIWIYPPPEEEFGGGDFVSLQEEPSTDDDQPL
jgi:CBS domain-containing protein